MSVAAFMAMTLHDPADGYHAGHNPIGAQGDFITAPEISQVFGELIGLWCASVWDRIGRPDPVILAELGPGRGVMAADLLRAAGTIPEFRRALRLHLVESSPVFRAEQERRLGWAEPRWAARVEDLPPGPILLVANEFLDALPIRQFVRGRSHWAERMVALDHAGKLVFGAGPESPVLSALVPENLSRRAEPGAVVEICPAALALAAVIGRRLACRPGAALFIDYGYCASTPGPSLRAFSRHCPVPVLAHPGTADLTADVDFAAFAEAAWMSGAQIGGPVTQGRFLTELGALPRLAALSSGATPAQRRMLESGVARLLDPADMGSVFKVMALLSPGMPASPGFGRTEAAR